MKKFIFSKQFFVVGSLFICFAVAGLMWLKNNQTARSNETLVIGMMSGWPPFMSINQVGEFEGFDVDVAKEVAKRLKKKCEIVDMGTLAALFIALDKNKIDMIFSGLDITQKRQQQLEMVYYVGDEVKEYYLMFWGKIPEGINTIQDLKNYPDPVITYEPGDSPEKLLDQFDFIIKKPISAITDQLLDLKYGKSLAIFRQPQVAKRICDKNPQIKLLPVSLPSNFQIYGMGIAFKKGSIELAKRVEVVIKSMRTDGTLKEFEEKWQIEGGSNES